MLKKDFRNHKKLKNILVNLTDFQIITFDEIYNKHINKSENSISKMFRASETLVYIIINNSDNYENLFLQYLNSKSQKEKLKIKYGSEKVISYTQKLKSRKKPETPFSIFDYKFWIKKGYTEEQSKEKVKVIQSNNRKKRSKESFRNLSKTMKHSNQYWLARGYSVEESEILRTPYLSKMKNDLSTYIEKYGMEKGTEKWIERCKNYKKSMKENLLNRKTAGYVSKESLKFFIPLYKFCRKLGLQRSEIYFGIKGSREFFIKDFNLPENGGKFYDFCIPKLNLIVEYHGTFWHPRTREEWENPWIDFNDAILLEHHKEDLAKQRKMDYEIVWSDDNHEKRLFEIKELIERKYCEY